MKDHDKKHELHKKYNNQRNLPTVINNVNINILMNILKIPGIIWKIIGKG